MLQLDQSPAQPILGLLQIAALIPHLHNAQHHPRPGCGRCFLPLLQGGLVDRDRLFVLADPLFHLAQTNSGLPTLSPIAIQVLG